MLDDVQRDYLERCSEERFRETFAMWTRVWEWLEIDPNRNDTLVQYHISGCIQDINVIAQRRNIDLGKVQE